MENLDFVQIVTYLTGLIPVFLALAGWAALVAVVINVGESLGIVKDGMAPKFNLGLNVGGLIVLMALGIFKGVTPEQFDAVASAAAGLLVAVLGFVSQFGVSAKVHNVLSNAQLPVIGKSYTPPLEMITTVSELRPIQVAGEEKRLE